MLKKKIVVFTNCHGEKYINVFKESSNIDSLFEINYIVSYQQLDNFSNMKDIFIEADILIINRIKSYNNYTVDNLKKILKPDALLIIIPFIRFNGYWLPEESKILKNFKANSVEYFPNINYEDIDTYLEEDIDNNEIKCNFNKCLIKLEEIELESDIKFFDWFLTNHLKYPMFRDYKHPTDNFINYIGHEIMKLIQKKYINVTIKHNIKLNNTPYEGGHFKPIKNKIKEVLNINYDFDKVFFCSRKKYLSTILNHEKSDICINNLEHMNLFLFNK